MSEYEPPVKKVLTSGSIDPRIDNEFPIEETSTNIVPTQEPLNETISSGLPDIREDISPVFESEDINFVDPTVKWELIEEQIPTYSQTFKRKEKKAVFKLDH